MLLRCRAASTPLLNIPAEIRRHRRGTRAGVKVRYERETMARSRDTAELSMSDHRQQCPSDTITSNWKFMECSVICLTETWLDGGTPDAAVTPPSFTSSLLGGLQRGLVSEMNGGYVVSQAGHQRAVGSEESCRVAAVCVPIEPWSLERSPDPGEAVTVGTGGPIWWSGPGEVMAVNAARDPGSENGLRTEAAQLSLLSPRQQIGRIDYIEPMG